jgi:hypothetical protein
MTGANISSVSNESPSGYVEIQPKGFNISAPSQLIASLGVVGPANNVETFDRFPYDLIPELSSAITKSQNGLKVRLRYETI